MNCFFSSSSFKFFMQTTAHMQVKLGMWDGLVLRQWKVVVIVSQSYLCVDCTLLMFSFELFSYDESQSNIIIICLDLERQCKLLAPSQHKYCWARKWLIFYLLVMILKNKTDLHLKILQNYANMYQYNACSLLWVLTELEAGTASCESPCSCMFRVIFYVPVFVMFSHHMIMLE